MRIKKRLKMVEPVQAPRRSSRVEWPRLALTAGLTPSDASLFSLIQPTLITSLQHYNKKLTVPVQLCVTWWPTHTLAQSHTHPYSCMVLSNMSRYVVLISCYGGIYFGPTLWIHCCIKHDRYMLRTLSFIYVESAILGCSESFCRLVELKWILKTPIWTTRQFQQITVEI